MHGPVRAARFTELPGSVEWVDDPHTLGYEPARVVRAFLGKHRVRGAAVRQRPRDELVRAAITLVAQPARVVEACFGAQGHEHPPGRGGELGGQRGVGADTGHHDPVCLAAGCRWVRAPDVTAA